MIVLRILGECAIEVGSTRLGPDSQVLFGTLLYLTLEPGRRVPRQEMTDVLWPGAEEDAARHNLRQAVYRLRQTGAEITTEGGHVCAPADGVRAPHERLTTDEGVEEIFSHAAPPVGPVLPGYRSGLSERLDEWVDQQRTLIHGRIRRALVAAMERYRVRGRWGEVEVLARKLLAIDPLNEEATLVLAESAALSGSKQYALSILDRYLAEIGPAARDIRLPAAVLRRRISERLPEPRWRAVSEAAFVGRAESMELLGKLLQAARNGEGSGVLLWGEPGIGKSRLAEELWKVAALQPHVQLAKVSCQPSDARRPLSVFADVVPELQRMPGAIGCSPRSLALLKRLTEYDVRADGPSEDAREAEYLYASVRRSLFDLVDAVSEDQCLVLVIEDVHWLDAESWRVLREMIPWAARRRILFVMTSRTPHATDAPDEESPKFLVKHHVGPIDQDAAVTLVELMVRERERVPDAAFRDWSVSVAEGNPFFLRELTTHWLQTGETYQLPASLQALIDDRLDRLTLTARRLLQIVAALGKNCVTTRVEDVMQLPRHALISAIEELTAAGMLVLDGSNPRCKHTLLSTSALNRLSPLGRATLHRHIATVLAEETSVSGTTGLLWDCLSHWEAAGDAERAASIVRSISHYYLDIGLPMEAAALLDRACNGYFGGTLSTTLRSDYFESLKRAGQWQTILGVLEQSQQRNEAGHDSDELLSIEAAFQLDYPLPPILERATKLVRSRDVALKTRLEAALRAFTISALIGEHDHIRDLYHVLLPELLSKENRALGLHLQMIFQAVHGSESEAIDVSRRLVESTRSSKNPAVVARAALHASITMRRFGHFDEEWALLEEAESIAQCYGLPYRILAIANRAATTLFQGKLAQSRSELSRLPDCGFGIFAYTARDRQNLDARLSLAEGDLMRASQLMKVAPTELHEDTELVRRSETQSLYLRVRIALSESLDGSIADDLENNFARLRSTLAQETSVHALALYYLEVGDPLKAHALLYSYLAAPPRYARLDRDLVPSLEELLTRARKEGGIPDHAGGALSEANPS